MIVGYGVLGRFATAAYAEHIVLRKSATEHLVLPVGIDTGVGSTISRNAFCFIWELGIVVLEHGFNGAFVLFGIHHFQLVGNGSHAQVGVEVNVCFTFLTVLGSDDDYTVGSHRTVDSCGCTVFQYFHALDVLRIHVVNVAREAVDDVERLVAAERLYTANLYRYACACVTTGFHDVYTGNLALQGFGRVGRGTFGQFFGVYR